MTRLLQATASAYCMILRGGKVSIGDQVYTIIGVCMLLTVERQHFICIVCHDSSH